jgi:hypothetical protein
MTMKKLLLGLLVAAGLATPALATTYPAPTFSNVIISKNGVPFPTPLTGTMVQAVQADTVSARVEADSFGASSHFSATRTDGTGALPTQVLNAEEIASFNAWAYNGLVRAGPIVAVRMYAAENIDGSHQGSKLCLSTTPTATVTMADGACQQPSGGFTIGSPTGGDQGAGTINVSSAVLINGVSQLNQSPKGYLSGCILSNDANGKAFDIASCLARDSTNSADIIQAGAFVKNINSAWVAGSSNATGCLDSGSIGVINTWYHIFAISKAAGANPDYICSTSATAPTLPGVYTLKRYIGSIKTDGSTNILAFTQLGNEFLWGAQANDFGPTPQFTTPALVTLSVPLGVKVDASVSYLATGGTSGVAIYMWSPDITSALGPIVGIMNSSGQSVGSLPLIRTNTSSQIKVAAGTASGSIQIFTYGWFDSRGQ